MKSRAMTQWIFSGVFSGLLAVLMTAQAQAAAIRPDAQLLITDLRVVEDPIRTDPANGARATWSFKYLIRQMAGDRDPAQFVMNWLRQWERDQLINGHVAQARPNIRSLIIDPWLKASGGRRLDLDKAPFKLLAIVNRMDMRATEADTVENAGEGRFVFGVLGPDGKPLPPSAGPAPGGFTVIFEYGLPASSPQALADWAMQWKNLDRFALGSPRYRAELEKITRRFTDRDSAPAKPNRSALNQIRTNDIALGANWELREFVINRVSGLLEQKTVALTPDSILFNGTNELAQLLNDNQAEIQAGSFTLPTDLEAASSISGPFQASDFNDFGLRTFTVRELFPGFYDIPWSASAVSSNAARHQFALNTCNGCHRDETATGFLHIGFPAEHALPASLGKRAALSAFLTGGEVTDPVDGTTLRQFADLERRREDFADLVSSVEQTGQPPRRPHRPRFIH